ncbi:bis(5'-nucleosyl)-tetraphosphatase (symmetrical) YqeK [Secundilactobacillus paracollinoides]|uniref:bis(5'-nucleosyl)-tetraphosphatase (symmetrical) n=1 Tax=Secundilactobacillus paracollinoides TaxID=240427 RepID=A0A1B2J1J6_9LACO|nr:bis(5'-nucleosyl)-tetraphosphatase (symmetrical) YqeK [Secundilactobacillus paracollinoides]ANZ62192.1 HD domain-containing protein [Secundilactobacillus paracollinoides]ANZ68139.1 HD domain-containing protein [Secundilactobacillus paracollinoides]
MTSDLVYSDHYTTDTRDQLLAKIEAHLRPERFAHVQRVEQTAIALAKQYGADVEKTSIAGLVHDYAKQRPDSDFLQAISDYRLDPDLANWNNAIWHGVVGPEFIKRELGIYDEEILNAVRYHTTGNPYMTTLEKIVYMADYIEPARDFDGVAEAREMTARDLDLGVAFQTWHTLTYLIAENKAIYPKTIETYNAWVPTSGLVK